MSVLSLFLDSPVSQNITKQLPDNTGYKPLLNQLMNSHISHRTHFLLFLPPCANLFTVTVLKSWIRRNLSLLWSICSLVCLGVSEVVIVEFESYDQI